MFTIRHGCAGEWNVVSEKDVAAAVEGMLRSGYTNILITRDNANVSTLQINRDDAPVTIAPCPEADQIVSIVRIGH
jgi:hypothetical protein